MRNSGTASSGTCQHPGGDHKYQSQHDDESDENPCVAEALFGLLLRATASLDLTRSPDCAGRRVANLLIDAQGNRSGIEIRHEMKTSKRAAKFRGLTANPDTLATIIGRAIQAVARERPSDPVQDDAPLCLPS